MMTCSIDFWARVLEILLRSNQTTPCQQLRRDPRTNIEREDCEFYCPANVRRLGRCEPSNNSPVKAVAFSLSHNLKLIDRGC